MTQHHQGDLAVETLFSVRGRSALVTGAASGIGLAVTEALARNGAHVTMADRDAASLMAEAGRLRDEGLTIETANVDVTDEAAIIRAVEVIVASHGRLDILIANAGISGGPGFLRTDGERDPQTAFEALPEALWSRVFDVNLSGVVRTLRAAVPAMKREGGGKIVVTSSNSSMRAEPHVGAAYVVSKGAVGHLIRQVAFELASYGITVNGLAPGPTVTNIANGRMKDAATRVPFERINPMHRLAQPRDIVGAALFLASPASDYVTGVHIAIDGGALLGIAD